MKSRRRTLMKMTAGIRAALGFVAALALAPMAVETTGAQDLEEITVVLPNPSALNVWPLWTAIGEGYMEEEGLKVNVQAVDGSSQMLQALAAGQGQIGLPGPAPVLAAQIGRASCRERVEHVVVRRPSQN